MSSKGLLVDIEFLKPICLVGEFAGIATLLVDIESLEQLRLHSVITDYLQLS